jgi:hypothetical protein
MIPTPGASTVPCTLLCSDVEAAQLCCVLWQDMYAHRCGSILCDSANGMEEQHAVVAGSPASGADQLLTHATVRMQSALAAQGLFMAVRHAS